MEREEPSRRQEVRTQQTQTQTGQQASPAIDYAKIQQMLDGTLAAKEDTALKAYFKQQGLSQEKKWNRQLPHLSSRRRPSSRM